MEYHILGRTGLNISAISIGTVSLGQKYGIGHQNEQNQPTAREAVALLLRAADEGVTLFDTAPTYGLAESLVGKAIGKHSGCIIATKVTIEETAPSDKRHQAILASIEASRTALRRETIDILQVHNATPGILLQSDISETLIAARDNGKVRFLGASVYSASEAIAAVECGWIDVIQVPYNLLDQRIRDQVLGAAVQRGVGIITRSALLKGALTERAKSLPSEMRGLREKVDQIRTRLGVSWSELPQAALRFCLSESRISSVLVGVSTDTEINQAVSAVIQGPMSEIEYCEALHFAGIHEELIDPRRWSL